jgi:hypothetical protein
VRKLSLMYAATFFAELLGSSPAVDVEGLVHDNVAVAFTYRPLRRAFPT